MKRQYLLLMICTSLSLSVFSQEKQTNVSFYNGDRFSISLFTTCKFYPEFQVESTNLEVQDARYAFLIRNDIPVKELFLSWGLGASYSDIDDTYLVVPVELKKANILKENLSLSVGLEVSSNFNANTRIKPLIGLSISF
ncbi:hypothetical protein [Gaoshiqia sp. Z1-71]|uniref:hypothetical protein n=1 Tax=Gaoshiqia hydrogeniformans TaxID=3290090 RepID=UPI003BF80051